MLLSAARAFIAMFGVVGGAILQFIVVGFQILFLEGTATVSADGVLSFAKASDGGITDFGTFIFGLLGLSIIIGLTRWLTSLVRRKI